MKDFFPGRQTILLLSAEQHNWTSHLCRVLFARQKGALSWKLIFQIKGTITEENVRMVFFLLCTDLAIVCRCFFCAHCPRILVFFCHTSAAPISSPLLAQSSSCILRPVPPHTGPSRLFELPSTRNDSLFAGLSGNPAPVKILKWPDKGWRQQRVPARRSCSLSSPLLFFFTATAVFLATAVRCLLRQDTARR